MSYRLRTDEEVADGIRRIAQEQVEKAIAELESGDLEPSEAIHQARKRFKKIRGVLRLVRDEIGEDVYRRENHFFRDLGRVLAPLRDAQVRLETMAGLRQRFDQVLDDEAFSSLFESFRRRRREERRKLLKEQEAVDEVCSKLRISLERMADWRVERQDFPGLAGGLQRVYKRGRKGYGRSLSDPSTENLHEWRKRVKYLWYHLRILRPAWPRIFASWARSCHDLANLLGDIHDLSELAEAAVQFPAGSSEEREALLALADRRQEALQQSSFQLGARIYAEKPGRFVRRIEVYWEAWR